MRARFTQSFKMQAVEKALSRSDVTSLRDVSDSLGVGQSTLHGWIIKARNQEFESISDNGVSSVGRMTKEKRPQDWSPEDKLTMVIRCATLDDDEVSKLCREQGLYPHHIQQWKQDFVSCVFWPIPITDSGLIRSPFLEHSDHGFWFYSITFTGFPESVIGYQYG